jgi:hypothetical protein
MYPNAGTYITVVVCVAIRLATKRNRFSLMVLGIVLMLGSFGVEELQLLGENYTIVAALLGFLLFSVGFVAMWESLTSGEGFLERTYIE